MRVKLFVGSDVEEVERLANAWLEENEDECGCPMDVEMSCAGGSQGVRIVLAFWYTPLQQVRPLGSVE